MKKFTCLLLVFLLLLGFGAVPVGASPGELKEHLSLEKGSAGYVPDEIVVKFKKDNEPFRVLKVPVGKVKDKVAEFSKRSDVVYAEPNFYAQAFSNDPLYNYQWNLKDNTEGGIKAEPAWSISTGSGVVVAVIDTGIAYEDYLNYVKAPDLANTAFVAGYDFVNNDAHPNDDNSHGTHVAGTIAQSTNNNIGTAGVAYNAQLMPVKVLNKKGSGTYDNIALGIRYAADNGARVINLSLGGPFPSNTLRDALAYAYNKGVTIVAAAGNDGTGVISYPAAYDEYVIAVGATRYDKTLAYYSNYGTSLDLVAPGGDLNVDQNGDGFGDGILQNTFDPNTRNTSDFSYWFFQGTSMASPHVAGVAALLIANGNASTPAEIQSILQETAWDLGTTGWDVNYGWGLVNADAALAWSTKPNTAPVVFDLSTETSEDVPCDITLTGTDAEADELTYSIVTGPANGTLSVSANIATYTPNLNFNGSDSFTFRAYDGKLYSNPATASITVAPVNDPPAAADQSVNTLSNTTVDITLDAADPDDDTLIYAITSGPSHGTISWPSDSVVNYTPDIDFTGSDSFIFTVSDSSGNTDSATVYIEVNSAPVTPTVNASITMSEASKIAGKNTFVQAIAVVNIGLEGAVIQGHWEGATSDTDTGTTDASGAVSLRSDLIKMPKSPASFIFVLDKVSKDNIVYTNTGEAQDFISIP